MTLMESPGKAPSERGWLPSQADVDLANLNSPSQIIISGEKDKIAKAVELSKTKGIKKAVPLNVAGAYHSRLMVSAQPKPGRTPPTGSTQHETKDP